jgi:hypothetical protein
VRKKGLPMTIYDESHFPFKSALQRAKSKNVMILYIDIWAAIAGVARRELNV